MYATPHQQPGPRLIPQSDIDAVNAALNEMQSMLMMATPPTTTTPVTHTSQPPITATQPPAAAPVTPSPKALNQKAMTVRLVTSKPTTSRRDTEAEEVARNALGDNGITASTRLFKDKTNPVRLLIAEVSAVYHFHKLNTLPYIDRGPRLLPVERYETYRDTMRQLTREIDASLAKVLPNYDKYVQQDIAYRNRPKITLGGEVQPSTRAKVEDYPTAEEFAASLSLTYTFAPLPDNSHWLFDVDDEDKAALSAFQQQVQAGVVADLYARIKAPLEKLVTTLNVPAGTTDPTTGQRLGIFRDTTVQNVVDAVKNVRSLSMGDENIEAACDLLASAVAPIAVNPDAVRESPVVRDMAAKKLSEVASKMGAFFGA